MVDGALTQDRKSYRRPEVKMSEQLKRRTAVALAWSAMQSWGVKLFALAVFFVLARFLSPAELGLAQSVILILAFVAILSEQGFQDAIVQRKDLSHDDLNLPFAVSMLTAVSASAVLFFFSREIADLLKVPDAASLIAISAVIPPLTAASIFEIAMRRRSMDFKTPAKAALFAALISCSVALVMAMGGGGGCKFDRTSHRYRRNHPDDSVSKAVMGADQSNCIFNLQEHSWIQYERVWK